MPATAIILGSTGLVGSSLLRLLLNDEHYTRVKIFTRKPVAIEHEKLEKIVTDFADIASLKQEVNTEVIFSCLGTTRKKTPDIQDYYRIDHFYPLWFARAGKENGVKQFHIVSSLGADIHSRNFYTKLKGRVEKDVLEVGIDTTCIYRPSLITGERQEKRWAEDFSKALFKIIDPLLLGRLQKYRSIRATDIALAMLKSSLLHNTGQYIYTSDQIKELAKG